MVNPKWLSIAGYGCSAILDCLKAFGNSLSAQSPTEYFRPDPDVVCNEIPGFNYDNNRSKRSYFKHDLYHLSGSLTNNKI